MKKTITKLITVFLFCIIFACVVTTQKANATIDTTYDWGFGIYAVDDGLTEAPLETNSQGEYVLNNNSVIVLNAFIYPRYPDYCYVRVDGNYVGNSTDSNLDYGDTTSGNAHINAFIIKNLTPGKHKIEARADRPWDLGFNYGPMQKIDTINVYVPDTTIPVTSISLDKTSLSVVKGLSSTLAATVAPTNATNKSVTWKSSNTAIATVDANGKVTGVAAGTASDGSGKSATCAITVTN